MAPAELIRIATRSSPMALAQVERVRRELAGHYPRLATEVVPVSAYGDRWTGNLAPLGGKAAFTREVDAALADGAADIAVHCLKDVPGDQPLPEGTRFAAFLRRDDVRDALVHPEGRTLDELPRCTRVGTSSVRRAAQLAASHPHLRCVPLRGNAGRRLEKLAEGRVDALVLAVCGLARIRAVDRVAQVLPVEVMCPPVGAGVLALRCRARDAAALRYAAALNDAATERAVRAERALLGALRGHCNSPLAGYARTAPDGTLTLTARVFSPDGATVLAATAAREGAADPEALGRLVAGELLAQGARAVIDAIAH
ncbi:hydroxymethylbilane synthase [Streptomyces sp. TRM70308]|uniref:hydroxymethylbilane synthase n=1 Tax=Streptomyces sp. TRM70308 TaxID=3131932 RepID=UPI003CFDCA29